MEGTKFGIFSPSYLLQVINSTQQPVVFFLMTYSSWGKMPIFISAGRTIQLIISLSYKETGKKKTKTCNKKSLRADNVFLQEDSSR